MMLQYASGRATCFLFDDGWFDSPLKQKRGAGRASGSITNNHSVFFRSIFI
jgi:hypothetical protein